MEGDRKAGFSIFWADDGLDTGPLLLQRECVVDINDTVDSLYTRFLLPEGIRAMVRTYMYVHRLTVHTDMCIDCIDYVFSVWYVYICAFFSLVS